jgi:Flp pilus assembly protein TadG
MSAPIGVMPGLRRRQSGLAAVEFVLAAPVLLLLLFSSVEFGHYLIEYSTLSSAVRDATRYVAGQALSGQSGVLLQGSAWTTLVAEGQNLAAYGNKAGTGTALLPSLSISQITVTQDAASNNVTVTATYPYQSLFGASMPDFMGGSLATNFTLTISTAMRAL